MTDLESYRQIVREVFLLATENFPREYHKLFADKLNHADEEFKKLENTTCKWQYTSGVTAIQCGAKIFNGATGKSLGFVYCPFCGKKIEYSA